MRLGKRCGGGDASLMNPRNWPVYRQLTGAELLTVGGLAGAVLGRRNRAVSALAGASLLAASALTRFGRPGHGPGPQVHHRPAAPPP
jgi:hypothetical protein